MMDEEVVAGVQEDEDTGVELQPIEHQSPAETIQRLADASDSETAKQCLASLSIPRSRQDKPSTSHVFGPAV